MKRWLAHLSCMLFLLFAVQLPAARAASSIGGSLATTERPALLEQVVPTGDQLLQSGPVTEDPGVPPGAGIPGDSSTIIAILAAAAGGFVIGLFVGVIGCCLMYYFSFY